MKVHSIYLFFSLLGFFVGLWLVLKRLYTFFSILYHFLNACSIYFKIKKNLKVLSTGTFTHEQKQFYCFYHFNRLFLHLFWMCQHGIFFPLATVDIQNFFWRRFEKQHPLFYIRGFSLWDLNRYANTIVFESKSRTKKSQKN